MVGVETARDCIGEIHLDVEHELRLVDLPLCIERKVSVATVSIQAGLSEFADFSLKKSSPKSSKG